MMFKVRIEDVYDLIGEDIYIDKDKYVLVPSNIMVKIGKRGVDVRMKWINYILNVITRISADGKFFVNGEQIGDFTEHLDEFYRIKCRLYDKYEIDGEISYFLWHTLRDLQNDWERCKDEFE